MNLVRFPHRLFVEGLSFEMWFSRIRRSDPRKKGSDAKPRPTLNGLSFRDRTRSGGGSGWPYGRRKKHHCPAHSPSV